MARPRKTKPKEVKEVKAVKEPQIIQDGEKIEEVEEVKEVETFPDIIRKTVVVIGHPQAGK